MIQRCTNEKHIQFKDWGGRGIKVCNGLRGFDGFFSVLGDRPEKKVIDRWPNNDGNYSCGKCEECLKNGWPLNVRWATMAESNRNKRDTRFFEIQGVRGCMTDLAAHFQIKVKVVEKRLRTGWPPEAAFTAPFKQRISNWIGR